MSSPKLAGDGQVGSSTLLNYKAWAAQASQDAGSPKTETAYGKYVSDWVKAAPGSVTFEGRRVTLSSANDRRSLAWTATVNASVTAAKAAGFTNAGTGDVEASKKNTVLGDLKGVGEAISNNLFPDDSNDPAQQQMDQALGARRTPSGVSEPSVQSSETSKPQDGSGGGHGPLKPRSRPAPPPTEEQQNLGPAAYLPGGIQAGGNSQPTGDLHDTWTHDTQRQIVTDFHVPTEHGPHREPGFDSAPDSGGRPSSEKAQNVGELEVALGRLSTADLTKFQARLHAAGYKADVTGVLDSQTEEAYDELLADTWVGQQSGSTLTPEGVLAQRGKSYAEAAAAKAAGKGGGGSGGTKQKHETTSEVDLTDPVTAQGILNQALEVRLGRKATPSEVGQFTASLQAAERANPNNATMDGTLDTTDGTFSNTNTTKSGGLDNPTFADDYITRRWGPEANTDKVGGLFQLAMSAIGSPATGS